MHRHAQTPDARSVTGATFGCVATLPLLGPWLLSFCNPKRMSTEWQRVSTHRCQQGVRRKSEWLWSMCGAANLSSRARPSAGSALRPRRSRLWPRRVSNAAHHLQRLVPVSRRRHSLVNAWKSSPLVLSASLWPSSRVEKTQRLQSFGRSSQKRGSPLGARRHFGQRTRSNGWQSPSEAWRSKSF